MKNEIKRMKINEINPYIRRASKHIIEGGMKTGNRINRHYQLHYLYQGEGMFIINGVEYFAKKGDFLIWQPGEVHCIESSRKSPMHVIGIQFDLTHDYSLDNYPCIHYTCDTFLKDEINERIIFLDLPELVPYTSLYHSRINEKVKQYLNEIVFQYGVKSPYSNVTISALLKAVLVIVMEQQLLSKGEKNNSKKSENRKSVIDVVDYLHKNYFEKMTNADLGDLFNYHPNYLNQMVLSYTGYTIQQYLIHIRMNKAIDLLEHSNKGISEIAEEVGGYSLHYFSRLFKEKNGVSPSEFRC